MYGKREKAVQMIQSGKQNVAQLPDHVACRRLSLLRSKQERDFEVSAFCNALRKT